MQSGNDKPTSIIEHVNVNRRVHLTLIIVGAPLFVPTFFVVFFYFFASFLLFFAETMASNEDLKKAFLNFANQGKSGATVQELDNKNWTKMAKDCGLYNKTCTSTDGDITFQKFCGNKGKHINFDVFLKFIDELAPKYYKGSCFRSSHDKILVRKITKIDPPLSVFLHERMENNIIPSFSLGDANAVQKYRQLIVDKGSPDNKGTKVATGNNVGKMTDTAQYTGAHKERFDESGKGKGKEGREDVTANDGYVTGYKGKGTYDK